jgi:hypothetical protein
VKSVKSLEEVCGGSCARGSSLKRREEKMKKNEEVCSARVTGLGLFNFFFSFLPTRWGGSPRFFKTSTRNPPSPSQIYHISTRTPRKKKIKNKLGWGMWVRTSPGVFAQS